MSLCKSSGVFPWYFRQMPSRLWMWMEKQITVCLYCLYFYCIFSWWTCRHCGNDCFRTHELQMAFCSLALLFYGIYFFLGNLKLRRDHCHMFFFVCTAKPSLKDQLEIKTTWVLTPHMHRLLYLFYSIYKLHNETTSLFRTTFFRPDAGLIIAVNNCFVSDTCFVVTN